MARPKATLTDRESQVINRIPSAKEAAQLYGVILRCRVDAKANRHKFALALIRLNNALGKGKHQSGLFGRWLRVQGISKNFAYAQMSHIPGSGFKDPYDRPSSLALRKVRSYLTSINKVMDQKAKRMVFEQLTSYIRKQWSVEK